jgi:hypothetical protein
MNDATRAHATSREQRRAAALRENLKRRKAQARAQSQATPIAGAPISGEGELTPPNDPVSDKTGPEPDGN